MSDFHFFQPPSCVLKEVIKKPDQPEKDRELSGNSQCEYHDWFDSEEVLCTHGLFNNTRCTLESCPHRQISTEVMCECFIKEDKVRNHQF